MTREEYGHDKAIIVIECDKAEALDMAIEALKADAVSREFYEDAVKANIRLVMENRELKEQIESADAVQGEWIGLAECSVCGKQADDFIDGYVDGIDYLPNYCPNCGARMVKGGDDE